MSNENRSNPGGFTRRDFLQLTGAGLALGSLAPIERAVAAEEPLPASQFAVKVDGGAITSLKRVGDAFDTNYVQDGQRLGDATLKFRRGAGEWQTFDTASFAGRTLSSSPDGATHSVVYRLADAGVELRIDYAVEDAALRWKLNVENLANTPLEIGDFSLPLLMNGNFSQQPTTAVLKHSFVSGDGSFMFWMRRNSVGPYLMLTPETGTHLEYWDTQGTMQRVARPGGRGGAQGAGAAQGPARGGYQVFIHSAAAGAVAKEKGTRWRQPNTSLTLAPHGKSGSSKAYGFKFLWAPDYDGVRKNLVQEGLIDAHIIPGMTVPRDLFARFALRTTAKISGVTAEFPRDTTIRSLGRKGDAEIYEARFNRLGENRLTVNFGQNRKMYLEFFSTEPVETLIAKRGAFIAAHQHRDPSKWYNGLLAEWANDHHLLLGPDNYDRIKGWRIYEVTCDDPGLGKPAFLASKNAEHPVQSEVSALDYYIEHFVWGGLQRSTNEEYSYAIYGIPDWKQNRDSKNPGRDGRKHFWRIYDYPHITLMYFGMYRVAKHHPQIKTMLPASEYLKRAYNTAVAMFTYPYEIEKWSAYQTGLYNELVIPEIIETLDRENQPEQAERLRMHWERKVRAFIGDRPDLFRSEYAFDTTGFESTQALVDYAVKYADRLAEKHSAADKMAPIPPENTKQFLEQQMAANVFCRGWLETAYYLYGSDIRGGGGNSYTLTYMSQMGGWSVLDYALHYAADPSQYLRLGYASSLSSWALLNSGTAESNYGYWYPGPENDGAASGGFEPAPYGNTWLEQPHHRGAWYYSCEIDLGFCGGLRCARTVLADDPIFGRFAFGGDLRETDGATEVIPKDGVRRRFHALIGGKKLHLELESDRFARDKAIVLNDALTDVRFEVESPNGAAHVARLGLRGAASGTYTVHVGGQTLTAPAKGETEVYVDLPLAGVSTTVSLTLA